MSFPILSLLTQVRNEEVSQLYLHEQKKLLHDNLLSLQTSLVSFLEKELHRITTFFIPERQQGKETYEERNRIHNIHVYVYCMCKTGVEFCYCR